MTIYKGPTAQNYSINSPVLFSPTKSKHNSKLTSFTSLEGNIIYEKSTTKPIRKSCHLVKDNNSSVQEGSQEKLKLYKANSVLPGTSNLMISQDMQYMKNSTDSLQFKSYHARNTMSAMASPFSSSARSSLKRAKLMSNHAESIPSSLKSSHIQNSTQK